jgi:hypothetical protein
MLNIIIPVVGIVATFGLLIRHFTGSEILVLTFRSAFPRLIAGIIASLFPLIWRGFKLYETFEFGDLGTYIIVCFELACITLAIFLIPISVIQFVRILFKSSKDGKEMDISTNGVCEADKSKGFLLKDKNKYPKCESKRLRKKSTYISFLAIIGIFIALIIFIWISDRNHWDMLFGLSIILAPFVFCSIFLAGVSAAFGKNICLDCMHRWR